VAFFRVPGLCSCSKYLPCTLFDAHFVSLVFRSVTGITFSGRLSRFGCKTVSLLSASHTAPCVRDLGPFFLRVIKHAKYVLVLKGRYVQKASVSVSSGECDPFKLQMSVDSRT
jgi:hypothetical protein